MPTVDWVLFAGDKRLGVVENQSATMTADWRFSKLPNQSFGSKEDAIEAARSHYNLALIELGYPPIVLYRRECHKFTDPLMKEKYPNG